MMILTKTEKSNFLRMIKNPQGPTLTFKVKEYSLSGDIQAFYQQTKKHAKIFTWQFSTSPLLVMSGFSAVQDEYPELKIVTIMI